MTSSSNDIEKAVADGSTHKTECDSVLQQVEESELEADSAELVVQAASDDDGDEENKINSVAFGQNQVRNSFYVDVEKKRRSPRQRGNPRRATRSNSILRPINIPFFSERSTDSSSFFLTYVSPLYNQLARVSQEESAERKSMLFCGSCCDLVTGCIVTNIVQICIMSIFLVICLIDDESMHVILAVNAKFDQNPSALREIFDPRGVVGLVRTGLLVAVGCIGIAGARKFHKNTVLFAAIWYGIDVIPALLIRAWTNVLLSSLCCYAQVHLFLELKDGRITRENYDKEKRCCCCHGS